MKNVRTVIVVGGLGLSLMSCGGDKSAGDATTSEPSVTTDGVTTGPAPGASTTTSSATTSVPTGGGTTATGSTAAPATGTSTAPAPTGVGTTPGTATTGATTGTTSPSETTAEPTATTGSGTDTTATDSMTEASTDTAVETTDTATATTTTTTGTSETGTTEPGLPQAPAAAYEACSGAAMPDLMLTTVLSGLSDPIQMVTPNGDPNTAFVVERGGALKRFDLTQPNPTATTLLSLNTSIRNECGFLGAALHPNFDGVSEKRIYLSYTPTCPQNIFGAGGSSALDVYEVNGDTATLVDNIFTLDQPEGNHNGGSVMFGPDGYLYYGLGDGGGGSDQHGSNGNGQDTNTPLGSLLRFDVDALDTPPAGNLTSADVGGASVDARIIHFGLRNPWRFSFDRLTGDLYIGDVGQDTREEVDVLPSGSGPTNFGWSVREGLGTCPTCNGHQLAGGAAPLDPVYDYSTKPAGGGGGGASNGSVTGGFVYRGSKIPGLWGRYLFADYVRGDIFALTYDGQGGSCDVVQEAIVGANIPGNSLSSFAEDANGELYVINMARGSILRVEAAE